MKTRKRGWDFEEAWVIKVEQYEGSDGYAITWDQDKSATTGWSLGVSPRREGFNPNRIPKVGDRIGIYTHNMTYTHGIEINGVDLFFETPEQYEKRAARERVEAAQKKRDEFEQAKAELDASYDALPEVFKRRLDKFRNANPDFRVEFESYEMLACIDAVKLAEAFNKHWDGIANKTGLDRDAEAQQWFEKFREMPWDVQKTLVDINEGHSGNSFGFAWMLGYYYVVNPVMVEAYHGALTPLVGCEEYGCPHPYEPAGRK